VPREIPYLHANIEKAAAWAKKFLALDEAVTGPLKRTLRIGIAWAGSAKHLGDKRRSARLSDFAPLSEVDGVKLFSIQKGPPSAQLAERPTGMNVVDLSTELNDFSDTAAAISALDLVIAVDTSVVHLAGAMGKPVWTLLAYEPDWRWMLQRDDTPWYPTMTLFRQKTPGDWSSVMREVSESLGAFRKDSSHG
jgi:hypothetical protein